MTYQASFGTLTLGGAPAATPTQGSPFRIALLGDFSGRQNRGEAGSSDDIAGRKLLRVDAENLDDVLAKLAVQLELPVGEDDAVIALSFASTDDFHPDQLVERVEPFADLSDEEDKAALLSRILHHADFQALESAWRGVHWLLGRAKASGIEIVLFDVSLPELAADLKGSDNLAASGLYRAVVEKAVQGPRGQPWAVLVAHYVFDPSGEHVELLGRLAKIAEQAAAPLLTTLKPTVLEKSFKWSADAAAAWQALRELPEAARLGVAVPRFLLRMPYGENTQSIDPFSYEEMSSPPDRDHYLWGNPALACAALLAQAFQKQGWALKPGAVLDVEKLPIHVYTVDDEQESTVGEAWLARQQAELLIKQGIMPLLGVREAGAMQLAQFLSVAQPAKGQPPCELNGPWSARSAPHAAPPVAADSASAPQPPPSAPVAEPEPEPGVADTPAVPAEDEMDPELAAMLKQLEEGS